MNWKLLFKDIKHLGLKLFWITLAVILVCWLASVIVVPIVYFFCVDSDAMLYEDTQYWRYAVTPVNCVMGVLMAASMVYGSYLGLIELKKRYSTKSE